MTLRSPLLEKLEGGWWKLATPLVYIKSIDHGRTTFAFTVPEGFKTDFASIPRCFWSWLPPAGDYALAAVLHDYLYSKEGDCSRFLADAIFREAMEDLGVDWWTRTIIYYAVRFFGADAWRVR